MMMDIGKGQGHGCRNWNCSVASWNVLEGPSTRFADIQSLQRQECVICRRACYIFGMNVRGCIQKWNEHLFACVYLSFLKVCWCVDAMPLDGYLSYEHPTFCSASETRGRSIIFLDAAAGYDMEPSIEGKGIWFGSGRAPIYFKYRKASSVPELRHKWTWFVKYWDETYLAIISQSITRTSAPLTIDFPKPSFQGLTASPTDPSD